MGEVDGRADGEVLGGAEKVGRVLGLVDGPAVGGP